MPAGSWCRAGQQRVAEVDQLGPVGLRRDHLLLEEDLRGLAAPPPAVGREVDDHLADVGLGMLHRLDAAPLAVGLLQRGLEQILRLVDVADQQVSVPNRAIIWSCTNSSKGLPLAASIRPPAEHDLGTSA
jgi:hypothetical protein